MIVDKNSLTTHLVHFTNNERKTILIIKKLEYRNTNNELNITNGKSNNYS